jgi:hypothetical protein
MPTLSGALSADVNGRYFVGPAGYQPKGTRVGSTDFAVAHALLVAADGTTALLPSPQAIVDGFSNPTTSAIQALPSHWNGGSWDRSRGDGSNGLWVNVTKLPTVATSTDAGVNSAATSQQILAANGARRGLLLTNTDANDAYLYYGTTATLTKFSVKIPAGAYWEMPLPIYTGRIDVIWAADGSGALIGSEI